ncbi:hypothetical protein HK099_001091, partial [Clydaea vesicula]
MFAGIQSLDISSEKTRLLLTHIVSNVILGLYPHHKATQQEQLKIKTFYLTILKSFPTRISVHATLIALLYIKRLTDSMQIKLHPDSVLSVIVVAFILADINVNDSEIPTHIWSQVSGLSKVEIVLMKREFLNSIGYQLHVSAEQYAYWIKCIASYMKPLNTLAKPSNLPSSFNNNNTSYNNMIS